MGKVTWNPWVGVRKVGGSEGGKSLGLDEKQNGETHTSFPSAGEGQCPFTIDSSRIVCRDELAGGAGGLVLWCPRGPPILKGE